MVAKPAKPVQSYPSLGIDLLELETFLAVAELGSFSLAAQHLHVTQPSVTGRVQRLESALGTQLLIRTTRQMELTPQGAALLAEATGTLQGLRKLAGKFGEQAKMARQRVVAASTPMLAALSLPSIIRDYSKRYTDVQVVLRDLRYPDALDAVDDGSADLAVLAFEGTDGRFRVQPLASEDMVLVVPANHPLASQQRVSLEDIASHPLLVIEQYEPMRMQIEEELKRRGHALAAATTVGNLNTLLGMLDAGMGATLLPRSMTRRSQKKGQAVLELDGLRLVRNYSIVRSRKAKLGTAAESFARFVKQAISKD